MHQLRNLKIFVWRLWLAWKMGKEIQSINPRLLKPEKIQGLDPRLLLSVNTDSVGVCVCEPSPGFLKPDKKQRQKYAKMKNLEIFALQL